HGRNTERVSRRRGRLPRCQGGAGRRRRRRAARIHRTANGCRRTPPPRAPLMGADEPGHDVFRLHQSLIGLRRRPPWLHTARTSPLRLANTQYVYATRHAADVLLVALNVDDGPLSLSLPELGFGAAQIVAGSDAPPESVVSEVEIEPHGWLIIAPR